MGGRPGILIATLRSKPHAVTTAVDLLLGEGYTLSAAVVLDTAGREGPVAASLKRLHAEFALCPAYRSLELHLQPIAGPDGPLPDVATEADAQAAFRANYRAVLAGKRGFGNGHALVESSLRPIRGKLRANVN